jgi:hypothetical protein
MGFEMTAILLTWVAIVLLSLVVAGLVRHVHALTAVPGRRGMALSTGMPAPGLDRLAAIPGRPIMLLFLSTDCASCTAVLAAARSLACRSPIPFRALFASDPPADVREALAATTANTDYSTPMALWAPHMPP